MRNDDFAKLLRSLADGWTKLDYEAVVEHFADELYYSDSLNYTFRDGKSLLEFFRDDEGKPQHCTFHDFVFDEQRQTGAAEYTYEGTFRHHGTVWVELKDNKIISWREYQHRSENSWEEFWKR